MPRVSLLILLLCAAPSAALVARPLARRANAPTLRLRGGLAWVWPDLEVVKRKCSVMCIDPTAVAKVPPSSPRCVWPQHPIWLAGMEWGSRRERQGSLCLLFLFAQVATGLGSANAVFFALAPKKAGQVASPPAFFQIACYSAFMRSMLQPLTADPAAAQAYGVKVGGASAWLLEFCGHRLVASGILAAMTLSGSTLNHAVALSLVPYTVFLLQGILQGRGKKHSVNSAGQYLLLTINAFM